MARKLDQTLWEAWQRTISKQQRHPSDLERGSRHPPELLPARWAAAHPESVRQERIAEQQRVSDAKRLRRLRVRIKARQAQAANG